MISTMRTATMVIALGLLVPATAAANPADLFGLGGPSISRARAGLVIDHDPFAAWRNPSAMGFAPRDEVSLVFHYGFVNVACLGEELSTAPRVCAPNILYDGNQDGLVDSETPEDRWTPDAMDAPGGIQCGYLRAFGRWLRVGMAFNFPLKRIVLFQQEDAYLPWYVRYKSRSQRLGIYLSASVRIVEGLHVGVGVSVLARARLELDFTVDAEVDAGQITGGGDDGTLSVDLRVNPRNIRADVRPTLSPIASVTWDLGMISQTLQGLRIGAVYRHPVVLKVDPAVLNLEFNGIIDEVGSLGEVLIPIRAQIVYSAVDFATPRQVAVGVGWDRPRFAVMADITWNQWSKILPNVGRIDEALTDLQIGLVDLDTSVVNARQLESVLFRDTVEIRVGGEWRPKGRALAGRVGGRFREIGVVVRGGYAFEPSFVPDQTGLTTFLDNPTHVIALGAGLWTHDPFGKMGGPISLDLFGQLHVLQPRTHVKDPALGAAEELAPGTPILGEVRSGGVIFLAGASVHLSI
jgi:hypothetical protein